MKASFSPRLLQTAVAAALLAGALAAPPAWSAETVLFGGEDPGPAGITLGGWGSGSAVYTTEEQQGSEGSLRIKTRDFYQGARLDYGTPRDLSAILREPNAYLSITVKVGAGGVVQPAGAMPGAPDAGAGMMGPDGAMPGAAGGAPAPAVVIPKVKKLRIALTGEKDSYEFYPLTSITPDATGWAKFGIPLAALAKRAEGSFSVKRIVIGTDAPDTIYIARLTAINDDTEIRAEATADRFNEIRVNEPAIFRATAQGGVTPLKLCWDFNAKDGIEEQAMGAQVEHAFEKPGRYTITFTAKPADGTNKEPAVETMEVEVIP